MRDRWTDKLIAFLCLRSRAPPRLPSLAPSLPGVDASHALIQQARDRRFSDSEGTSCVLACRGDGM